MNATAATGSMCVNVPDISTASRIDVIGVFTDAASVPVITHTAKIATESDGRLPNWRNVSPQIPPASEPTARIGMKMPPGAPEPKLVEVNSTFTTNSTHSMPKPTRACSAMAIRFEPPPSTSGSQMPIGSASAIAIKGRLHAGSLPYSVWKPSSERFISEPTKPATNPSGISHPYSPSGSWPMVPKSSTGRRPKQYFDTKSAVRDAAVAPIRIAGEKLRCTPSKANIMPDSGALNAADRPAAAPAVTR